MKEFFKGIHNIPDDILEEYFQHWDEVSFKKGDFITREGETEKHLYYVIDGVQRSYYINDGKEYTIAFTYPPSFTGVPDSFYAQQPSRDFLQCVTDSKLKRISYEEHQQMLEKHREIETFFRKLTEQYLVGLLQRNHELMADTIEERFKKFTKRSPHLFKLVSHKQIASYLNIDPTNFSKLYNSIKM